MSFFLCKLWPFLAGGLIAWLLAGWLARRFKHSEPAVETIVEKEVDKIVDNPQHLTLISKLERENSQLEKLRFNINRNLEGNSNTVEKVVDNPKHLALISKLERENSQLEKLRARINRHLEEKAGSIDKKEHLSLVGQLEEEKNLVSSLKLKLSDFESGKSDAAGKDVEKQVDNPEHLKKISLLEDEINTLKRGPAIDLKAAKAAGITIKGENDLTAIEGIGPKINDLIQADGIGSFYALADTSPEILQKTLDKGGSKYKMANPGTWPDQANLAANNRWPALKALQDVLIGGVYPDGSSARDSDSAKVKVAKSSPQTILDTDAAKSAGFKVKQKNGQDDFTLIEGVGPKINELIHAAGVHTFSDLGNTLVEDIQKILDEAGSKFNMAKPGTWPAQSDMVASNRWEALKAWQDKLDGGEES